MSGKGVDERGYIKLLTENLMEQRADIDQKLCDLSPIPLKPKIFRVHDALRNINVKAYEPQLIAIGPYHHPNANDEKKAHLRPMEEHKLRYLKQLLERRNETSAQRYIVALQQCEERARKFYAERIDLDTKEFVEMMLLDGCFIIEFLRKYVIFRKYMISQLKEDNNPNFQWNDIGHGIDDDPNFQLSHIRLGLRRDLQLFENQLPLFVLIQLFNMTKEEKEYSKNINIPLLALCCFQNIVQPAGQGITEINFDEEPPHLLSLMHACCCYPFKESLSKAYNELRTKLMEAEAGKVNIDAPRSTSIMLMDAEAECPIIMAMDPEAESTTKLMEAGEVNNKAFIESATKLMEAGIKFSKAKGRSLFDITFQNGTMKIPTLVVDDHTDCLLRNYIAYEQYLPYNHQKYFTNYRRFIDCLINSEKDVEILCHRGIVQNRLGDDEAVASMVNKLGDNVIVDADFYDECYSKVFSDVNKHCNRQWNIWMAKLRRDYFNSPWAFISFAAAFLLLLLTITQTVFSILSVV